jgi:hypothetical protein
MHIFREIEEYGIRNDSKFESKLENYAHSKWKVIQRFFKFHIIEVSESSMFFILCTAILIINSVKRALFT